MALFSLVIIHDMGVEDETSLSDEVSLLIESKSFEGSKTVMYDGFHPGHGAEVAYLVKGKKVIFTATGKTEGQAPTTINGAEKVIEAICRQEGIDWRDFEFFDLQTGAGQYSRHARWETTALDRLIFDRDSPTLEVKRWETLFDTESGIGVPNFEEIMCDRLFHRRTESK